MRVDIAAKVSRSWDQRSRSGNDGHGNLVNSKAPEPLKESEQKCTQIVIVVGGRTISFQGDGGFEGQGYRNARQRRHHD